MPLKRLHPSSVQFRAWFGAGTGWGGVRHGWGGVRHGWGGVGTGAGLGSDQVLVLAVKEKEKFTPDYMLL